MKTNKLLAAVLVMQGAILVGQWTGQPAANTVRADVQLPNPSERQIAILDELKSMNGKLDRLYGLMSGGDMKVKVEVERK